MPGTAVANRYRHPRSRGRAPTPWPINTTTLSMNGHRASFRCWQRQRHKRSRGDAAHDGLGRPELPYRKLAHRPRPSTCGRCRRCGYGMAAPRRQSPKGRSTPRPRAPEHGAADDDASGRAPGGVHNPTVLLVRDRVSRLERIVARRRWSNKKARHQRRASVCYRPTGQATCRSRYRRRG